MNFFDQHFSFPVVAQTSGIKHDSAAKWITRGYFVLTPEDRVHVGQGGRKMLTARTSLQLILAVYLANNRGMAPGTACEVAERFAHDGDQQRGRGKLFKIEEGETVLLPDRGRPHKTRVVFRPNEAVRFDTYCSDLWFDGVPLWMLFRSKLPGLGVDVMAALKDMEV